MGEIAVIKRDELFQNNSFQGFKFFHECPNFELRVLKDFIWRERDEVEENPELKQPIPYCLIWNPKTKKLFYYKRGSKKEDYKEKRLHNKISVGIIHLTAPLNVGDKIHIKGAHDDFTQTIDSMQIEHESIDSAKSGDSIGIKVIQKVHPHDKVYKIIE